MENKEILEKLNQIFTTVLKHEVDLKEEYSANDVENWDSLNHVRLIVDIEKEFNVRFTYIEVEQFKNIGSIINAITRKQNK